MDDKDGLILAGVIFDKVENVHPTPEGFDNNIEMVSELQRIESAMITAINRQIPEQHRLYHFSVLKFKETILHSHKWSFNHRRTLSRTA